MIQPFGAMLKTGNFCSDDKVIYLQKAPSQGGSSFSLRTLTLPGAGGAASCPSDCRCTDRMVWGCAAKPTWEQLIDLILAYTPQVYCLNKQQDKSNFFCSFWDSLGLQFFRYIGNLFPHLPFDISF